MEIEFRDMNLKSVFEDATYDGGYSRDIVKAFRKRMQSIKAAKDERDIRAVKGNRLEKLKGRKGEYSIRLNDQWRLIITFETRKDGKVVVIVTIKDYH